MKICHFSDLNITLYMEQFWLMLGSKNSRVTCNLKSWSQTAQSADGSQRNTPPYWQESYEGPFQTASNVSETLEFDALCGSRFLDNRVEQVTQGTYFNLKYTFFGRVYISGSKMLQTTTEKITFNVSCYWNFLIASSLSVAAMSCW